LANNNLMVGGGGVVLAVLGSFLLVSGTGPFIFGLLVLLVGVGLVVHLLLRTTETDGKSSAAAVTGGASIGAGLAGMFDLSGVKNMSSLNQWVGGGLMAALSLVGLFLYSRATDGMFGLFGALLFFFGLAVVIVFVHQATDYSHEHHPESDDERPSDQGPAAA
jgi:hypothetical protein